MPFTFPSDGNGKAGAVKAVNNGNNFTVPVQIQTDDGITPIDAAHQFPVIADLKAGANLIGKVGIDQTTPGTTNKVVAGIDQTTPGTTNKVVAELSGRKGGVPTPVQGSEVLNVAAAGTSTISITPPVGELWRIKYVYVSCPAPTGASAGGTHRVDICMYDGNYPAVIDEAGYNVAINIASNLIINVATTERPTTKPEQQRAILNLVASNATPLVLCYKNYTDKTQTNTLIYRIIKEVEYIV
jgi:hypothetical protein